MRLLLYFALTLSLCAAPLSDTPLGSSGDFLDSALDIYKAGVEEAEEKEKNLRRQNAWGWSPLLSGEHGQYSGAYSALLFKTSHDDRENARHFSLPLSLLHWGRSDRYNYANKRRAETLS